MDKRANAVEQNIEIVEKERELECVMTPEEFRETAQALAQRQIELQALEMEKASVAKSFAARINLLDAHVQEMSQQIKSGTIRRKVICQDQYDFDLCIVRSLRTDTLETIMEREMTGAERQRTLPLTGGDDA